MHAHVGMEYGSVCVCIIFMYCFYYSLPKSFEVWAGNQQALVILHCYSFYQWGRQKGGAALDLLFGCWTFESYAHAHICANEPPLTLPPSENDLQSCFVLSVPVALQGDIFHSHTSLKDDLVLFEKESIIQSHIVLQSFHSTHPRGTEQSHLAILSSIPIRRDRQGPAWDEGDIRGICVPGILIVLRSLASDTI